MKALILVGLCLALDTDLVTDGPAVGDETMGGVAVKLDSTSIACSLNHIRVCNTQPIDNPSAICSITMSFSDCDPISTANSASCLCDAQHMTEATISVPFDGQTSQTL